MRCELLVLVKIALFGLVLFSLPPSWVTVSAQDVGEMEQKAQGLDRMLVCPVCPGETIDQSQVVLAKQMQELVREKLKDGESEEEILEFFIERYGENVLTAPRKQGFNLLAWVFPPVAAFIGLLLLAVIVREMKKSGVSSESKDPGEVLLGDEGLDSYLSVIDEELAQRRGRLRNESESR